MRLVVAVTVLVIGAIVGFDATLAKLLLLFGGIGAIILLRNPRLSAFVLLVAAMFLPFEFSTGTAVPVNPVTLIIPGLVAMWLLQVLLGQSAGIISTRLSKALILFVGAGLLSLLIGTVLWEPSVPKPDGFAVIQLAQWAIFAFSAVVFLLANSWISDKRRLRQITFFFLITGGTLAIFYSYPGTSRFVGRYATAVVYRAPFWLLLTALAGGQLLFNRNLSRWWRLLAVLTLVTIVYYSFVQQVLVLERGSISSFLGVAAAIAVLLWSRFPGLRWPVVITVVVLVASGVLLPGAYELAGGDDEWFRSGGSRMALIARTLDVSMHNPVTGLGPAAYRHYSAVEPLQYAHIVWTNPRVSSHNNYVDIFAHTGIVGLGLFLWFMFEVGRLCLRLRRRFRRSFEEGYINAMLATWVGILVIMLTADWFLPFVYNISFRGFQASVLVWFFFGGLVVLENLPQPEPTSANPVTDA